MYEEHNIYVARILKPFTLCAKRDDYCSYVIILRGNQMLLVIVGSDHHCNM